MPDHPTHNPVALWAALLSACEGRAMELPDGDPMAQKAATLMHAAQLLECTGPNCFTLAPKGEKLLKTLKRLREFSLS